MKKLPPYNSKVSKARKNLRSLIFLIAVMLVTAFKSLAATDQTLIKRMMPKPSSGTADLFSKTQYSLTQAFSNIDWSWAFVCVAPWLIAVILLAGTYVQQKIRAYYRSESDFDEADFPLRGSLL